MFLPVGNLMAQQSGIQMGSVTMFPTLGLAYGYDDNILFTNNDALKLSSYFKVFAPGIRLEAEGEKTDFTAQYSYTNTSYNADSKYDFDMHNVSAALGYTVSSKSRVALEAEYSNGSSRIGTGNQQGNIINLGLDPDEWHSSGLGGKWHYGGIGAHGSLDLSVGTINRQYDNNRIFTATRNRKVNFFGINYTHKVTSKTSFLTEFKRSTINYDSATLDNAETRLLFGADWQATGKTNARALVGYLQKDFDDPIHNDFSGVAVEVGATWSPKSYSHVDLKLARETDETNGNGSYIVRNSADLGWNHFWRARFSTLLNIGSSTEDYVDSTRKDDLNYYSVSANYKFTDWMMSGLGYRHTNRNSTINDFEYKDDSLLFTLELSK